MIGRTLAFSTPSSSFLLETTDLHSNNAIRSSSSSSSSSLRLLNSNPIISCSSSSSSSSRNHGYDIPKLEPFSRSKLQRAAKEPPLIQKSETQLADYCSVLEGEDSYDCWKAYFELKDLEQEAPKEEVERLIMEAGGVKSLVGCVHGVAAIHKAKKEASKAEKKDAKAMDGETKEPMHMPDGLPRPAEEIEEEEKARMPDSPYTRLLRVRGTHPAWYSPAPDHETD